MILFRLFLIFDAFLMSLPYTWRKKNFTSFTVLAHNTAYKRHRIIQQNLSFAFNNKLSATQKSEI